MRVSPKWLLVICAALLPLFIVDVAYAWGPAAHLHYGIAVLEQVSRLGDAVRAILTSQAIPFLYGCVSADIVLAKKLGRAANHCHNWENGIRLIEKARTPRIKAFSFGYVSHLAADTVSHNCYVPSKTIESYDSGVMKHLYWELLFDKRVTSEKTTKLFRELARGNFSDCDDHLESLITTRVFDFSTNKKVFNHLLMLQSLNQWQKMWSSLSRKSPWPLRDTEVRDFSHRSVEAMVGFLKQGRKAPAVQLDAIGAERLRSANQLRRHYRKQKKQKDAVPKSLVKKAVKKFAKDPTKIINIKDLKAA